MGKKYTIELKDNQTLYTAEKDEDGVLCFFPAILSMYKEPDLEQVRKEAYEDGYKTAKVQCNIQAEKDMREVGERHYQKGLSDAWEAARKISMAEINGRCSWKSMKNIFGIDIPSKIFKNFTASESIEKLKAYEQEKEEWLRVGDEVEGGDEKYIVLQKYLNNIDELMVVLFNRRNEEIGTWHLYNGNGAIFKKTGRHFPEIVAVLAKMKEN